MFVWGKWTWKITFFVFFIGVLTIKIPSTLHNHFLSDQQVCLQRSAGRIRCSWRTQHNVMLCHVKHFLSSVGLCVCVLHVCDSLFAQGSPGIIRQLPIWVLTPLYSSEGRLSHTTVCVCVCVGVLSNLICLSSTETLTFLLTDLEASSEMSLTIWTMCSREVVLLMVIRVKAQERSFFGPSFSSGEMCENLSFPWEISLGGDSLGQDPAQIPHTFSPEEELPNYFSILW